MRSITRSVSCGLFAAIVAAGIANPAPAVTIASLGHASGAQCTAVDVNDAGVAVGACSSANTNGPRVAWIAVTGAEVSLTPLVTGQSCGAGGITNGGRIVGACTDGNSVGFAVSWSAAAPTLAPAKLAPLPGLLGLLADVSTAATAYNHFGTVGGASVAANGSSTAVIWPAASNTPVQVSARGDNCGVVDIQVQAAAGNPTVLLDCLTSSGTAAATIATPNPPILGLPPLVPYAMNALLKPAAASYCVAQSINASSKILGTCIYPGAPFARAAVWSSPASVPGVLTLANSPEDTVGKGSTGLTMNDAGHFLFQYRTSDGRSNTGYFDLAANSGLLLPPLHPGSNVRAVGLSESDRVIVMGINESEHGQAAVWTPGIPGVLTPVPLYGGGAGGTLVSISSNGSFAVGTAVDSDHVANAVLVTLP